MPAAAVASFTPAITGMSGTWVAASGETVVDIGTSGFQGKGSALYHLSSLAGRGRLSREARKSGEGEVVSGSPSSGSQDARHLLPAGGKGGKSIYFFFVSAGFMASGLVIAFGSSGLSMRSTLAASRSLVT